MPLVILLNGVYGSHRTWAEQGEAHLTALRLMNEGRIRPMVIAMPADGIWSLRTGFVRHLDGAYERWIMQDVIACVKNTVPELGPEVFLAGLSIGGYGALRLGAKYGGLVRGISAHSPITRLHDMARFVPEPNSYLADEPFVGVWIARHRTTLPPIRFCCRSRGPRTSTRSGALSGGPPPARSDATCALRRSVVIVSSGRDSRPWSPSAR